MKKFALGVVGSGHPERCYSFCAGHQSLSCDRQAKSCSSCSCLLAASRPDNAFLQALYAILRRFEPKNRVYGLDTHCLWPHESKLAARHADDIVG